MPRPRLRPECVRPCSEPGIQAQSRARKALAALMLTTRNGGKGVPNFRAIRARTDPEFRQSAEPKRPGSFAGQGASEYSMISMAGGKLTTEFRNTGGNERIRFWQSHTSASLPYIVLQRSLETCCDVHAQTDGEYHGEFHAVWPWHLHCAVATRGRRRLLRGGLERPGRAINLLPG
jgi:hypothetical protein